VKQGQRAPAEAEVAIAAVEGVQEDTLALLLGAFVGVVLPAAGAGSGLCRRCNNAVYAAEQVLRALVTAVGCYPCSNFF
jgi:hypothetical protein